MLGGFNSWARTPIPLFRLAVVRGAVRLIHREIKFIALPGRGRILPDDSGNVRDLEGDRRRVVVIIIMAEAV